MKKKTRGKKAPTMLFSSDLLLVVRVVIVSYPSSQHDNGAFWCVLVFTSYRTSAVTNWRHTGLTD